MPTLGLPGLVIGALIWYFWRESEVNTKRTTAWIAAGWVAYSATFYLYVLIPGG